MPRVRILQKCFDNRRRYDVGEVVSWPAPAKGQKLPSYVEVVDEDARAKGQTRAAAAAAVAAQVEREAAVTQNDDVI